MKKIKKISKTKVFKVFLALLIVTALVVPTFFAFAARNSKFTIEAVTDSDDSEEPVDLMHLERGQRFRVKINLDTEEVYSTLNYGFTYDNRYFKLVEAWKYSDVDKRGNSKIEGDYSNNVSKEDSNLNKLLFSVGVYPNYEDDYSYNGTIGTAIFEVVDTAKGSYTFEFAKETNMQRVITGAYNDENGDFHPATYELLDSETENANVYVDVPVSGITLNVADEINMIVGDTKALEVTPNPTDTTVLKNATYSSDLEGIAEVSNTGVITAKKTGKAKITVNAYGKSKTITVNVTNPIKRLYFDKTSETIKGENKSINLNVKMEPTTPDNAEVKWESLNPEVATVNQSGTVTSVKAGVATIKVTSLADENVSATITINVVIPVTKASIDKKTLSLEKNESEDITITYEPAVANSEVTWKASDDSIVSITPKEESAGKFTAVVKALKGGNTDVVGKITNCEDSVKCEFTVPVTVNVPLEDIKIQKDGKDVSKISVYPTETATLTLVKVPEDATVSASETVKWQSSNDFVTVDSKGVIKGITAGKSATITATYAGKTATITVEVKTPVEGGNLSPSDEINLITNCDKGKCQEQMTVLFFGAGGTTPDEEPSVTWKIKEGSATDVASVSSNGLVKALKAGNTIVVATYKTIDGVLHTLEAKVNVTVALESLSFAEGSLTIHRGDTTKLPKLVLNPTDATVDINDVVYEYDEDIISLNNGVITALSKGSTNITAKLNGKTATLKVTVDVPVENIIVKLADEEVESLTLARDSAYTLTAEVDPVDADDTTVKWAIAEGSATDVISIDPQTGAINALKKGKTKITVTAGNFTKTIDVEVNVPVKQFTAQEELEIYKGDVNKKKISVTINPTDADDQEITWSSDDEAIATVSEDGIVTGHKAGSTTITGTLENGMSVTVRVTVSIIPLTDIDVVVPDEILKGRPTSLKITPTPANTTEFENIEYESSNEDIFTVDENGVITGVKEGSATLTIRVGGVTKEIEITITEVHAESIDVYVPSEKLGVGEEMILQPYANPTNCTDELTYTFESSDENIATVDENGTVKGIAPGTVTIKITADNGMEKEVTIVITEDLQFRQEDSTVIPNTGIPSPIPYIIVSILSLSGIGLLVYKKHQLEK